VDFLSLGRVFILLNDKNTDILLPLSFLLIRHFDNFFFFYEKKLNRFYLVINENFEN
jgi:hypothetical protein